MGGAQGTEHIVRIRDGATGIDRFVTDPVVAHFFGTITASPTTIEQLVIAMASIANRDMVLNYIQYFQTLGVVELVERSVTRPTLLTIPPGGDVPLIERDYSDYQISESDLADNPDVPMDIKREVIFLFTYGTNLNFYKILNVPPGSKNEEVCAAFHRLKAILAPERFAGKELGAFGMKLDIVRKLVEQTVLLCDPAKREKYDRMLTGHRIRPPEQENADPARISRRAEEHYTKATFFAQKGDFESTKEALREMKEALAIDPNNRDYKEMLQKLEKIHKKNKIDSLLSSLEQSDFALFDGELLKKELGKILDLAEHSAEMHMTLAELMMNKGHLMVARKLARQSKLLDPAYAERADRALGKIEKVLDYYKRTGKVIDQQ